MAVLPTSASFNPATSELAIVFDGELTASDDVATAGLTAILPGGKRAIFGSAGVAANDGGVGTLKFVIEEGEPTLFEPAVSYAGPIGYAVFVNEGTPAASTETEKLVSLAASDESQAEIDASDLGLLPDRLYCVSVFARNAQGLSATAAETWFETDDMGTPRVVPSPVRGLDVTPLAGGRVLVEWTYDETTEAAIADEFVVTATPADGEDVVEHVTHEPPQRGYRVTLTVSGPWCRVRVQSQKGGSGAGYVPAAECLLDAAAPAVGISGMAAV